MTLSLDVERAVNYRRRLAAHQREAQLVRFEISRRHSQRDQGRDYGCGDPTPFVRQGDMVLDLSQFRHSRNERASSCSSLIAVIQATYLRKLAHSTQLWKLYSRD